MTKHVCVLCHVILITSQVSDDMTKMMLDNTNISELHCLINELNNTNAEPWLVFGK